MHQIAMVAVKTAVQRALQTENKHIRNNLWLSIADTDTEKYCLGIIFSWKGRGSAKQILIISDIICRLQQIQLQTNIVFELFPLCYRTNGKMAVRKNIDLAILAD